MQKISIVVNDGRILNPIVNDPLDDLETHRIQNTRKQRSPMLNQRYSYQTKLKTLDSKTIKITQT